MMYKKYGILALLIILVFPVLSSPDVIAACDGSPESESGDCQGCDHECPDSYHYRVRYGGADTYEDWTGSGVSRDDNCGGTSTETASYNSIGTDSDPITPYCNLQGDVEYRWRTEVVTSGDSACDDPTYTYADSWLTAYTVNWDDKSSHCTCSGRTYIDGSSRSGCCGDNYGTHGATWDSGTAGEDACCSESPIGDNTYCSANSRWTISGNWCDEEVRQNDKMSGDFDSGSTDLTCGCDSSGVICGTLGSSSTDGLCGSGACASGDMARDGSTYYNSCAADGSGYGYTCDASVNPTDGFQDDGVCGGSSHDTCYTEWASDESTSITSSSNFGTESNVCSGNSGLYCDDVSDGSFVPDDQTCMDSGSCIPPNSQETNEECDFDLHCVEDNTCIGGTGGQCLRDDGQSCDSGSQCVNDCVDGTCQTPSSTYDGDLCSGGSSTDSYTSHGIITYDGSSWSCDVDHASLDSDHYSECSLTGYGIECDSDTLAGGYSADGVCGDDAGTHDMCYTQWAADTSDSVTTSTEFGSESEVCYPDTVGWQCDDVSDAEFSPGDFRCDGSNTACVECNLTNHTKKTDDTCEEGCGAVVECDDEDPYSTHEDFGWCYGTGGCENFCDSYIRDGTDTGEDFSGEPENSCGGCSSENTGQRCDSDFDGVWDGVCGLDADDEWGCVKEEVALHKDEDLHYDGCVLVPDDSECTAAITVDGFIKEGLCGQDDEYGDMCCRDEIVYVDPETRDCACREEYDGFKCSTELVDGDWNGVCAQESDGAWRCNEGEIYYDGNEDVHKSNSSVETEGFMCDSFVENVGFEQDGMAAELMCRTNNSNNHISCPDGSADDCYFNCQGVDGTMCMGQDSYTTNVEFFQEGLCTLDAGCADDSVTDHVCYDNADDTYYSTCDDCMTQRTDALRGNDCTITHTSGGNYQAEGLCTVNVDCSVGEQVCVDHTDDDKFKEGCDACNEGSLCDSADGTTSFTPDGYCSATDCVSIDWEYGNYVDIDGTEEFDNEPRYCGEDGHEEETRNELCSFNTESTDENGDIANHEWDGLCVEYDPVHGYNDGWKCDEELVTCRFDYYTDFDHDSSCSESVLNSTTTDNAFFESSVVVDSEISFSTIEDSEVRDSMVADSIVSGTNVYSSNINGSNLGDSRVLDSDLCAGISGSDVRISDNVLISGVITFDGREYVAPFRIDDICEGAEVDETGFLTFNETSVSDGMPLEIYYVSSGTGYDVTVDLSEIGGDASEPLTDDNSDGIYEGTLSEVDYGGADGDEVITAHISADSDWTVDATLKIRNTGPSASLDIVSLMDDEEMTSSSTVVLESSYSDPIGIDSCRFANEDPALLDEASFTDCQPNRYWDLEGEDGERTVFMEVQSLSGATTIVNDTILYNSSKSGDDTAPSRPAVIADYNYTNNTDQLDFRWYNATDEEQALLGNPIYYEYYLCEEAGSCEYKGETTDTEVTLTNLSLTDGHRYYLRVSAFNVEGLYSPNSTSSSIYIDTGAPNLPIIDTDVSADDWEDGDGLTFNFSATDTVSGIDGYTTSLSTNEDVTPDSVVDNTNGSVTYDSLPDGYYTFRVRGVDKAGNIGPMENYTFKVSTARPTVPRMLTFELNGTELEFEWTESYQISGIEEYELMVASDSDFEDVIFNESVGLSRSHTLSVDDGTYFGRVRSKSNVGTYSLYSNELGDMVDQAPPKFVFHKPRGISVSARPLLTVRTDKVAYCTYFSPDVSSISSHKLFDTTNLRNHESRINVDEDGTYQFEIVCTDQLGNSNSTVFSFDVDQSREPDVLTVMEGKGEVYEGHISTVNFTVQDGETGLGEIHHSEFDVDIDAGGEDDADDYSIADLGDGKYQVAFVTPEERDEMDIEVVHTETGISDGASFDIVDLELDVDCGDSCDLIRDTGYLEDIDEYSISIYRDDLPELDVHMCPDSEELASDAECILIENTGDDDICLAFSTECDSDRFAYIIDE